MRRYGGFPSANTFFDHTARTGPILEAIWADQLVPLDLFHRDETSTPVSQFDLASLNSFMGVLTNVAGVYFWS